MRSYAVIIGLSMIALLLGATVLGIITLGPTGIFAGPVLARIIQDLG
jgi:hypothetical protein